MDLWESTIDDYQQSQTLDSISSVLHTAEAILKQDLADFELDWFIETLLSEPISLLDIISARSAHDVWSKVVKDAYKLLSDIVEKQYKAVDNYIDSIVEQCKSPHDARTRSHALQCLTSCLKSTQPGALASQYISELGQASTCKAPLAVLVGTICEYHPATVEEHVETIWRTYLNLLASDKNTDLVCKSLLKGVWCLFKNFGTEIPVNELTDFYNKLTGQYLEKCDAAVLPILRDYASLFKEKLAEDSKLRSLLWTFKDLSPIVPVYEQAASVMTKVQIQNILLKEIAPKTNDNYYKLKFTALRAYTAVRRFNLSLDVCNVDVYALEYTLRREVTNEVAEEVSWCIESNVPNSEKLLQTAILFYNNLPNNRKKDIVVNGLLNSPDDVKHATINFLTSQSCQEDSLHTYLPLWRDILTSQHENINIVYEKFMENVLTVVDNFLDDSNEDKKIPEKLSNLLILTSHIIPMPELEESSNYQIHRIASKMVELVDECGLEACVISVVKVLMHLGSCDLDKIQPMLQTDRCKDEAILCVTCLTLLNSGAKVHDVVKLDAIEVILSRKDAEPKTLSLAIKQLDEATKLRNVSPCISKCIPHIEKHRTRKDLVGKDARVLQRDITFFLGRYSNSEYVNESTEDNSLILQLKGVLSLDIPDPADGTTYKINLNRLLHLAVTYEHEEALKMLLNIICANLCNSSSPLLQEALGRVVVALCRATVGSPRPNVNAAAFCDVDATLYILQQISGVKSPAVRRMLADVIEGVLLKQPGSGDNEKILTAVYKDICRMLSSDNLCKSLLKGVWCLFKNFGTEIPVNELTDFYNKLTGQYLEKCDAAVLPILRDYASLFKEKLAEDSKLRSLLWTFKDLSPIVPVYEQAASVMTKVQIQNILLKEIAPKTNDNYYKLKFTALRAYTAVRRFNLSLDVCNVDVYALEYTLRREVTNEVAEEVSWCIESNVPNSEKLLQTAILFYNNLPNNRKKDIVVNGLLNSPDDVKHATINFLTSQSCQEDSLHTYLPLWRDILTSQHENINIVYEKFMENVLTVVDNFLDDSNEDKKIPEKLSNLLILTSHIIPMPELEESSNYQIHRIASKMVELVDECGLEACVISVVKVLMHLGSCDLDKIQPMLQTDRCKDEAILCVTCLTLLNSGAKVHDVVKLDAIEVILSRKDAEPKTLSLAIKQLDEATKLRNVSPCISKCIPHIEKHRTRKDLVGKDARVLQRDITFFLGRYSNSEYVNESTEDNSLILQLKGVLSLDIPDPADGTTYKINLNRLLHLAVTYEHEEALKMLLNIICANLCNSSSPLLQEALGRVVVALCRATVGSPRPNVNAAAFCDVDATLYILQQISGVKSPAVRRMLADVIEGVLLKQPGSGDNEKILTAVYKDICRMLSSDNSLLKLGGLEVTESLLTALKVNRHQTKLMLPTLLILISKTNEQDSNTVFENSSELYIENIALFGASALDSTITDLLTNLLDLSQIKPKIYKDIVKSNIRFISKVMDCSKAVQIVFNIRNDSTKFVYLWSEMAKVFDFKDDYQKEILDFDNGVILNAVFKRVEDGFALEANLRFMNQFASVLLKFHYEATLKHISSIIENLTVEHVKNNWKHLSECLTRCRQICLNTPLVLLKSFETWSEGIEIKTITEHLEKEKLLPEHALEINALNKMIEIFNIKDLTALLTVVSIDAKTWAKTILKLFARDNFINLKKHVMYLSDLLSVSLRFLTLTDVRNILLEGHGLDGAKNANLGVEFCRFFLPVFVRYLVKKPFLLVQEGMENCWMLLNDIVKLCVRRRWHDDQLENVLELVDQLWPIYETKSSFKDKHTLLLDLSCLNVKLAATSRPMRWVTAVVDAGERDEKVALVTVLPGGEEYSDTYKRYASLLPTRLSDMDWQARAGLRALLDALAGNNDTALLDIVCILADGDDTPGWWDEAMASCMASLASLASKASEASCLASLVDMHARCRIASPAVCRRLLVPYIRFSPSSACEKFFASILKESLEGLSSHLKPVSQHLDYKACVQNKTVALEVFLVLFEKVPASKIESPSSRLYEHMQTDNPWHLPRELMRLCFKLRDKLVTPDGASPTLSNICREFQYTAYKCMCACICLRKPEAKIYYTVFNIAVWNKIVDENADYKLPLKDQWNQHKIIKPVSIPMTGGKRLSRGSSTRQRLFLRTLSENPMDHDLTEYYDDLDTETQDIELADSSLNSHPCAGTLTVLFQHAASLTHCQWLVPVQEALMISTRNVRWLLAMVICNSKEELKPHASQLLPGLLAVITDTSDGILNGLHVDILNTLISWECAEVTIPKLNTSINYLIKTALCNVTRPAIFKMLEDVLERVLRVYGRFVTGDITCFGADFDNRSKFCLKLLLRFVKNKVCVPSLLSYLLSKLSLNYKSYRSEMALYAEVIGTEIANSSQEEQMEAAGKLKKILEDVRRYNISDYVKILNYSGCCDAQQIRVIVDLTQKLRGADQKKCLNIISTYISEHPDSSVTTELPPEVEQMVEHVSTDRQFDGLFTTPQFLMPPPAKRAKTEISSPILNTIGRNEKRISKVLAQKGVKTKIDGKLCKNNMAVRFVECFYIAIYLPMKYGNETDLSVCMSQFYNMLFSHLKSLDSFKQKKLRDEPFIASNPIGLSKSRTKKMVGTLRSFAYNSATNINETDSEIDVQVSIEKILDTFLQFAKVTPEASMDLLIQLLRACRGFDSRTELARLLISLLTTTPQLVVLARCCVDQLTVIDGFMDTVEELKKSTLGSEGEQLFRLLHEEARLRCGGTNLFVLGTSCKDEDLEDMLEDTAFSIEGLVSAFQKLSNWDELTIQDKRKVERRLPALWTDRTTSIQLLNQYKDPRGWFGHMVQLYHRNEKDVMKWLRIIDKYPRRQFVVSSIIEAQEWSKIKDDNDNRLTCHLQKNDCLVEWAGRLLVSGAYEESMDTRRVSTEYDSSDGRRQRDILERTSDAEGTNSSRLSRSHELLWCESANEKGLYNLALSVIKRNHLDLYEDETLQWLEQKMLASSMIAFELNDRCAMQKTLDSAQFLPEYYRHSNSESVIGANQLIMELKYKLDSLSPSSIDTIMTEVDKQVTRIKKQEISLKNKKNLASLIETAVLYYNGLWDKNELSKDEIIVKMCEYLGRYYQNTSGMVGLILDRIASCDVIAESSAAILLAKIKPLLPKLPSCYIDILKAKINLFPAHIVSSCGIAELEGDTILEEYKQRCQLLCHADYLLLQYCHDLKNALLNDGKEWDSIFSRIMKRIFDNPFAGADYQSLSKYKSTLNAIRDSDIEMKRLVIKGIIQELESVPVRETIRLTHVCPSLAALGPGLERLLQLPNGVLVVKIEEELRVFTDSIKRPCVVTVVTSDGNKRRYLHKNEDLRADAVGTGFTLTPYTVIPLSEDCGLIEFLEDHKRIRDLIASTAKIDEITITRQSAKDDELVLASKTSSIQSFHEICGKIPAYSLRSAIEDNSASIQDFISKKRTFLETLSDITIINWLFGLGDRHLQNLLYSIQDGGVRCIDWGAILQYGDEIPPARLTRNILAVCDTTVLESRLQKKLTSLRDSYKFMIPLLKLSFRWMDNFDEKLSYIQGVLKGRMVSYQITKDVLQKSNCLHKTKYIQLLDVVFEKHVEKDTYSIEEQISCLLLQCTDPWILSVTRSGWEPWL